MYFAANAVTTSIVGAVSSGLVYENIKNIFTTKQGGTGLGLSIAHAIVQAHEGRVEVTSRVGEGTSFRVVLPCREVQGAPRLDSTAA